MEWTKKQLEAIELRNKNILVSAAAGSGKTSVLVERIRKLISEDRIPVSQFLVVTFTEAAAAEMKERLRASLGSELAKADPGSQEAKYLRQQLLDLESSNISTFHAFGLKIIRRFFYKLDIEPGFTMLDETEGDILKELALDYLLEEEFQEYRDDFIRFVDAYSGDRNYYKLRQLILDGHKGLMSMPYPWPWMENSIEDLEAAVANFQGSKFWTMIRSEMASLLREVALRHEAVAKILENAGYDDMADKVRNHELKSCIESARIVEEGKGSPNEILKALEGSLYSSVAKLSAPKEDKEFYDAEVKGPVSKLRASAKAILDGEIKNKYIGGDLDKMLELSLETVPYLRTLLRLEKKFDEKYKELKKEQKAIDFNDIEHYALEVLEDPEVSKYYRETISQIFIDEYQDTNLIQDAIIEKIKRENNLFMVGDIKQSIYRFRLAEPDIFQSKYISYRKGDDRISRVVDLNSNHRSKKPVIDLINRVFKPLMDGYDENAQLNLGNPDDGGLVLEPELRVVIPDMNNPIEEEVLNLEREAHLIANIIEENLGKPFYDTKLKEPAFRPLEEKDIVILRRSVESSADVYQKVLKSRGFDTTVQGNDGYFDTVEIGIFVDLLRVVDNIKRDVALIGVLHSEIFDFTSRELGEIRAAWPEGSFADAFVASKDEKCEAALERIMGWREMSRTMSLPKFIWKLLVDSGCYAIMGALSRGSQRQSNLRALCDIAEKYSKGRQATLYGFLGYIDAIKSDGIKMPEAKDNSGSGNVIRIMTIHKSKGLEFPMVILAGAGSRFKKGNSGSFYMHKDIGVGLAYVDRENHWQSRTLIQQLVSSKTEKEIMDETIRILYVALTRARDKLVIVAHQDNDGFQELARLGINEKTNFLQMIAPFVSARLEHIDYENARVVSAVKDANEELTEEEREKVLSILKYEYPHPMARTLKSKYSVTELSRSEKKVTEEGNETIGSRRNKVTKEASRLTAAERGTIYHRILETTSFADLKGLTGKGLSMAVRRVIDEMVTGGLLVEEEALAIDPKKVQGFFESPVGKRAIEADAKGLLEKERPFTLKMDMMGEEVLVQGIIDCYFFEENPEEEGEYRTILLDYKSNWIDRNLPLEDEENRLRHEYSKQLEIYKTALEEGEKWRVCEVYLYLLDIGHGFLL